MQEIKLEDNIAKLKDKFKMSEELINKILDNSNSSTSPYEPIEISTLLACVDNGEEEQRLCTIIENLNKYLGISYETLASFSDLDTEELKTFLRNPNSLIDKKKFTLAVRIMFIHFVLKEQYAHTLNR